LINHLAAGAGLSRILEHTLYDGIATITAFRGDLTKRENEQRNKELSSDLYYLGYGYITVEGHYTYADGTEGLEDSYFVINKAGYKFDDFVQDMLSLGRRYEQEAVLTKAPGEDEHAMMYVLSGSGAGTVSDLGLWHTAGDVQASWDSWSSRKGKVFRFAKLSEYKSGMRRSTNNNYVISIARRNLRAGKEKLL